MTASTLVVVAQETGSGLSLWEVVGLFGIIPAVIAGAIAAVSWRFSRNTNSDQFPILRRGVMPEVSEAPPTPDAAGDATQPTQPQVDRAAVPPNDPDAQAPNTTKPGPPG